MKRKVNTYDRVRAAKEKTNTRALIEIVCYGTGEALSEQDLYKLFSFTITNKQRTGFYQTITQKCEYIPMERFSIFYFAEFFGSRIRV
jgi:hypothetical protein